MSGLHGNKLLWVLVWRREGMLLFMRELSVICGLENCFILLWNFNIPDLNDLNTYLSR